MANEATGTVYALVDPRTNAVRYIGATTRPLKTRLQGHLKSRVPRVKAWVDELSASDVIPRIEAITEGVAARDLQEAERAEITRRLIAGEKLLNESATATARKHIEHQRQLARQERHRAAWEHAAHQVRNAVGGPLPPGDITPIPLNEAARTAYGSMLQIMNAPDEAFDSSCGDRKLSRSTHLMLMRETAGEELWRSTQARWGRLRSAADKSFDTVLAGRVHSVFANRWTDLNVAPRYLALVPWGMVAVGPWAALAERAGMDASGQDFIDWVSDDPSVREALTVLLLRSDGRMGPLSVLDDYDRVMRPSTGLVALTAAHHPGFEMPDVLGAEVRGFIEVLQRGDLLTPGIVELLLKLAPEALDNILGPDLAASIDSQLGLPAGTSCDVLTALLKRRSAWQLRDLDRVVARAQGAFPTITTPDFTRWTGSTAPMFQAIVAALVASEHLPAPIGTAPDDLVDRVRALWRGGLEPDDYPFIPASRFV
ncbi:GIY-YIG nuclease family protein [Actinomadura decatromicini]|uniref:GIY-YIG nuclease family protein n=1 Tax=Actinomadura decatromicini TaxID=2604572 RepID=A0A5D3FBL4_9ACTN|nr:GIY-YIG nuclease family protein [Actinomadura decatromicini]TYK45130.1 GIY-YIG nuclease family protein [Actinomadura decatromicini]